MHDLPHTFHCINSPWRTDRESDYRDNVENHCCGRICQRESIVEINGKYFLLIYIYLFCSEPHYLLNHDGTIIRTTCKKVPLYKSIEFDMALK